MTEHSETTYYEASLRLTRSKQAMDSAQAALEKAEAEWHEACIELDRLDGRALHALEQKGPGK